MGAIEVSGLYLGDLEAGQADIADTHTSGLTALAGWQSNHDRDDIEALLKVNLGKNRCPVVTGSVIVWLSIFQAKAGNVTVDSVSTRQTKSACCNL